MPASGKVVAEQKARTRSRDWLRARSDARAASWLAAFILAAPVVATAVPASYGVTPESTAAAAMTPHCVEATALPRVPSGHPPPRPAAAPVQVEVTCNAAAAPTAWSSAEASSAVKIAAPFPSAPVAAAMPCTRCDAASAPEPVDETNRSLRATLVHALEAAMILLIAAAIALIGWVIVRARDEDVAITSYWGGFGASGSGWEMTRPAVALLGAGLLLGLAAVLATAALQSTAPAAAASGPSPSASAATTGRGVAWPEAVASAAHQP